MIKNPLKSFGSIILTILLLGACGSKTETHNFEDIEEGVVRELSTGMIIAYEGGCIFREAPNGIASLDHDTESWLILISADNSNGISFKFMNGKPSIPFTAVFDNGSSVVVNKQTSPQDEYYCVLFEQGETGYNELYNGLMSSKECTISDAFPNQKLVFEVGGFQKLLKYL